MNLVATTGFWTKRKLFPWGIAVYFALGVAAFVLLSQIFGNGPAILASLVLAVARGLCTTVLACRL
jgi:hypothetical protein